MEFDEEDIVSGLRRPRGVLSSLHIFMIVNS